MITQQARISAIENSPETGEKKSIKYKDDFTPRAIKRIPLEYLLYNPHNGRIRSYTKSFESQFHELKPSDPKDKIIIEQYLYDSAIGKNERTLESLEKNGQQEVGIITKDGVIIDGNRRAMLLNMLSKRQNKPGFFNAIVLPDNLHDNEKEIVTLETSYQMGVDSKVDYNPIEKYIRCKELLNRHQLSIDEIATIMAEDRPRIEEWLKILEIMDEYLVFLGTPEIYTRLEKREGHFVDLNNYLKTYKKPNSSAKWAYTQNDIIKLRNVYFSYIRLGIPVQRARVIAKPTSNNSFFCNNIIWNEFINEYDNTISSYSEPKFELVKTEQPDKSDEDIIRNIDNAWKNNVGDSLLDNLSYSELVLKDILEQHAPVKILRRVINSLGQIDADSLERSDKNEIIGLLQLISSKVQKFNEIIS